MLEKRTVSRLVVVPCLTMALVFNSGCSAFDVVMNYVSCGGSMPISGSHEYEYEYSDEPEAIVDFGEPVVASVPWKDYPGYPSACITEYSALNQLLAGDEYSYSSEDTKGKLNRFDEDFFKSNNVLVVYRELTSSADEYKVTGVTGSRQGYRVLFSLTGSEEMGACMMAGLQFFIPVPKNPSIGNRVVNG